MSSFLAASRLRCLKSHLCVCCNPWAIISQNSPQIFHQSLIWRSISSKLCNRQNHETFICALDRVSLLRDFCCLSRWLRERGCSSDWGKSAWWCSGIPRLHWWRLWWLAKWPAVERIHWICLPRFPHLFSVGATPLNIPTTSSGWRPKAHLMQRFDAHLREGTLPWSPHHRRWLTFCVALSGRLCLVLIHGSHSVSHSVSGVRLFAIFSCRATFSAKTVQQAWRHLPGF